MAIMPATADGFPWRLVLALAWMQLASCFSFAVLFPFVPFMMVWLGVVEDVREPGFYTGFLISASQFARIFSAYPLGRWSDRTGRRPVLVLGLGGIIAGAISFGLAPTYGLAMAVCRPSSLHVLLCSLPAIAPVLVCLFTAPPCPCPPAVPPPSILLDHPFLCLPGPGAGRRDGLRLPDVQSDHLGGIATAPARQGLRGRRLGLGVRSPGTPSQVSPAHAKHFEMLIWRSG